MATELLLVCESMQRTLCAYDPSADCLTRKANMPRQTAGGVTGVINNKLYVLSGTCNDDVAPVYDCVDPIVRRLLYRYDPVTDSWITLAPAPHPHEHGVGGVINGKFYVAGGSGGDGISNGFLDVYDPWSNTWKTLAPLPAPRSLAAGAIQNTKLWVIDFNRNTYVYDPVTNRWTTKARMPAGGFPSTAVPISTSQSHILVVNGSGPEFKPGPSQLYTP
jgi:N-acetylneuraminic acid mutarotase